MEIDSQRLNEITTVLRNQLEESVKRNLTEGLLLSGGLDTSILACLAVRWKRPACLTVAFENSPALDLPFARMAADYLGLDLSIHQFGDAELREGLHSAISILKTFDPMEVRNSAAAYIALKIAKIKGLHTVMTGDGGDELFAGYSFFFNMTQDRLDAALKAMWAGMNFSSIPLGESLGIEVKAPFLDPEFKPFATAIEPAWKVHSENGKIWGKWILRKAFEGLLPSSLIWREKAPLEAGTGTSILPQYFASRISDGEFRSKQQQIRESDGVRIRDKEQLVYYEVYRKSFGPPEANSTGKKCPDCGAAVKESSNFCRTCGAYPLEVI